MPHDVFISHSSSDKLIANAVCAGLENAGIRCWIAPRDVVGGLDYADQISDAIEECRAMVLIFSSHANDSRHVKAEIDAAFAEGKILLPFRIEAVEPTKGMSHYLRNTHWLDALGSPTETDIGKLAENLKRLFPDRTAPFAELRSEAAASPAMAAEPPTPPAAPQIAVPPPLPKAELPPPSPAKKKANLLPLLLILLAVLVLLGAGIGGFFFLNARHQASAEYKQTQEAIADAWLAIGDVNAAETAAQKGEWDQNLVENIAAARVAEGNRDRALEALTGGGAYELTKTERYVLARLEAENGAIKQALASLKEAEKTGRDDSLGADARIAILLASTNTSAFALDQAKFDTLLTEARELISSDNSWDGTVRALRLAQIQALAEDTEGARENLKTIESELLAEEITNESAPAVAALMEVYLALEQPDTAKALFQKLRFKEGADSAMLPLVNSLLDADQLDEARKLALSGLNPQSQRAVVEAYLANEQFDAAVAVAKDPKATGIALPVLIALAYQDAGDTKNAALWRDQARATVLKRPSRPAQAEGLAEIARIEAEAGNTEAATKTLQEAIRKSSLLGI